MALDSFCSAGGLLDSLQWQGKRHSSAVTFAQNTVTMGRMKGDLGEGRVDEGESMKPGISHFLAQVCSIEMSIWDFIWP